MELLQTQEITFGYENNPVIKGVSVSIKEQDYICVVGENGSGKSTLIKGILGLLAPLSGTITLSPSITRKEIGYLPQQTTSQKHFPASVYEIVASGVLNQKRRFPILHTKEKQTITNALAKMHILDLKYESFKELSGGQQQKVLLARSLCAAQKLLILDEPITGLDEASRNEVYQIIHELQQQEGMTIVMITHNLKEVLPYATKLWKIEEQTLQVEMLPPKEKR